MIFRIENFRHPRADEMAVLREYHAAQLQRFGRERDAATKLLSVGVSPMDTTLDVAQLAALTNLTTVVMNTPDAYSLR